MARIASRYRCNNTIDNRKKFEEKRTNYNIGIYARVSVKNNISESINNQIELAKCYIKEKMKCCTVLETKEYIDNGISGYSIYNRQGINSMLDDVMSQRINCIIVKDLSRLGRNYITVCELIEQIKRYNARLISINDYYDSYENNEQILFNATIKCMFNEMYIRDTGNKIRISKQKNMRDAKYVGVYAPYGYKNIGGQLYIEKNVADIVKNLYKVYVEKHSIKSVKEYLYNNNINNKLGYYKTGEIYRREVEWTYKSIKDTLSNRVYIGELVQNKTKRVYEVDKIAREYIKENKYITIKNCHTPIIEKDIFYKVQNLLKD